MLWVGLFLVAALPEPPEAIDFAEHALPTQSVYPDELPIVDDDRPAHLGAKILYINFDGGQLGACGGSSPQGNCSSIFSGTVLPYSGDAAKRASVVELVRRRVEDFGITVTTVRPASGDYDMEMVGDWSGTNPSFAGIAPAGDCWDNGGGEISFTLEASATTDGISEIILQELAHSWGLDHVDEQQDLLYPTTTGQNKTYRDECYQIVANVDLDPSSGFCSHHSMACGSLSLQNSYQELLLIFGESIPDTMPPVVQILQPTNGDVIEGGDFDLIIGMQDDQLPAVMKATITIASDALEEPFEDDGAYATPGELSFPITGLPDGDYTISVDATDESDNPASDMVSFSIVGSDAEPDTGGNGDNAEDGDGGSDGDGDGGSGGAGTMGPGADPIPQEDEGCGCGPARGGSLGPALLILLFGGPRRARPHSRC